MLFFLKKNVPLSFGKLLNGMIIAERERERERETLAVKKYNFLTVARFWYCTKPRFFILLTHLKNFAYGQKIVVYS